MNSANTVLRHSEAVKRMTGAILDFLTAQSKPCTEKQILKNVRGRKQYKIMALRQLVKSCQVHRFGSGKKSGPFFYAEASPVVAPTDSKVVEELII